MMRPHSFEAPEALVDAFPRKVSWMVKEPVMVLWEEPEPPPGPEEESSASGLQLPRTRLRSLGHPSAMDKYPNVTLWIGRGYKENEANRDVHREEGEDEDEDKDKDKETDEDREKRERQGVAPDEGQEDMIVLLQMTFHIKVAAGNRKKAFDMFCVVPCTELVMPHNEQHDHGNFLPLSINDLPPTVYSCLKHPEPSRRLLHVRFFARRPSRVLMHHRPPGAKLVTGTPLHLMLLLQSLSCTLSFDAYLSYSTYAAECLKSVATRLESGVSSPAIDLDRVYVGKGGCFDYWEQFNPEHFAHLRVTPSAYLQHAQQSPPHYSSPTHDIAATRKRPRPCSSSTNSPPRYLQSEHVKLHDVQTHQECHVPPPSYVQQRPRSFSPALFPSPPAFPSTPLAFPPTATTSDIIHSPTILVAASHLHTSPDRTTVDYSDYVPDSPLDVVCTPYAAITTITTPCAASPPVIALSPAISSPSSEHSVSTASPPLVPTLTCLFRSWIVDMNTLSPEFYKLRRFHVLLLSFASTVISGSKNGFIKAKAKATTSVLVLARNMPDKKEKDKDMHRFINPNLLHELDLLLQWMYTHDLDATGAERGHRYGDGPLLTGLRQMAAWGAALRKTLQNCADTLHPVKEMRDELKDTGKREAEEAEPSPEALVQGFRQWEGECVAQFYLSLAVKTGRAF